MVAVSHVNAAQSLSAHKLQPSHGALKPLQMHFHGRTCTKPLLIHSTAACSASRTWGTPLNGVGGHTHRTVHALCLQGSSPQTNMHTLSVCNIPGPGHSKRSRRRSIVVPHPYRYRRGATACPPAYVLSCAALSAVRRDVQRTAPEALTHHAFLTPSPQSVAALAAPWRCSECCTSPECALPPADGPHV